jgi:hypothetical protein
LETRADFEPSLAEIYKESLDSFLELGRKDPFKGFPEMTFLGRINCSNEPAASLAQNHTNLLVFVEFALMKFSGIFLSAAIAVLTQCAHAAAIYLTTTSGAIYQYDSVADMATQTATVTSGTLVATQAAYGTDQATTMHLGTGVIYRVTSGGDVVSYASLAGYLSNSGATTVTSARFTGATAINGLSYDGGTGGFYAIASTGSNTPGDLVQWASLADLLANTNATVTAANYTGNLFNFYDPDVTTGTSFGEAGFPATTRSTHYYQSAGNGRLEGWDTLSNYASIGAEQGDKRVHYSVTNVYGGTSTAYGSNTIDANTAFAIPEPSFAMLGLVGLSFLARRRR